MLAHTLARIVGHIDSMSRPVRQSSRSRAPVENYYRVTRGFGSDEELIPSPGPARKRTRRVILDSDEESEHNGEELTRPQPKRGSAQLPERTPVLSGVATGSKGKAKLQALDFAVQPTPTDSEANAAEDDGEVDVTEFEAFSVDDSDDEYDEDIAEEE